MNIKQVITCSVLSLILTGCATTIDYKKNLQQAGNCCAKLSDVKYKKLKYDEKVSKEVGVEGDKSRSFKSGKSFYLPVELPPYEGAYEIQIESIAQGNKIFIPRIALLDGHYKIIKQISSSSFVLRNGAAKHQFFVNSDLNYRYMVLYTSPEDLDKKGKQIQDTTQVIPIVAGGFIFYYTEWGDITRTITSAEGGKLFVNVLKYAPVKIGAK
ncbi:MAG: MalM family protein [Thiotrichaceae bacterium]